MMSRHFDYLYLAVMSVTMVILLVIYVVDGTYGALLGTIGAALGLIAGFMAILPSRRRGRR